MKTVAISLSLFLFCLSSCTSLQHISDYSNASIAGLNNFQNLHYGFEENCLENCQFKSAVKGEIEDELNCNCSKFAQADSVDKAIFNIINAYFVGLYKLSDNHRSNANFNLLADEVKNMKWLDEQHTNAYGDLANLLLESSINAYRRGKLTAYIDKANTPIQILIKKLQSNLNGQLVQAVSNKNLRIKTFYQDAVRDKSLGNLQKVKIAEEYYHISNENEDLKRRIQTYSALLISISDGHQKLFENRAKLSTPEIKNWLVQSATNIQVLYADFNKLRNH